MDRTQLLIGVAVALFSLGLVGVIVRRHVLVMLMCMELMLNGVNLSFVTFAQQTSTTVGAVLVFLIFVVATVEIALAIEYRFTPGANTGWHRHGHDYVVVPLMDGKVKLLTRQGENFAEMKRGVPYFRNEGVEHDVINATDGEYAFIEIELK